MLLDVKLAQEPVDIVRRNWDTGGLCRTSSQPAGNIVDLV